MSQFTRRQFLGSTASAVIVAGTLAQRPVFGANGRVGIGVMGLHNRGRDHLHGFGSLRASEVVAMCDVDDKVLQERATEFETNFGYRPRMYRDVRDMLADDGVEAVSIAAPNHWHVLAAIWACQAGKDVYIEKPMSHTLWEGRQMVEAAKQYGRIVQHGTQRRSDKEWGRAVQRLQAGVIGDVYMARIPVFKERDSLGKPKDTDPPEWLDWKLWQGPAKEHKYNPDYVHYNWHWFWRYGNGEVGNNAVHFIDVALWAMQRGIPTHVYSAGGRFGYKDMGETPNTQVATCTYDDGTMLVIDVRGRATNKEHDVDVGILCYGSDGYMANTTFYDKNGKEIPDKGEGLTDLELTDNHFESFVRAVQSRKQEDIRGTALDGHHAAGVCHLANIAYRMDRDLRFNQEKERFIMNVRANSMTTVEYRPGFEVPDLVAARSTTAS